MEVSLEELNTKGKESVCVTDGKEDADECNHFTIRGYVAGVRKRDAKICWPLFMPNNESSDILAMLPPLHVSKFKRWSCLNCLHTINTSADVTGTADFTNIQNKEIKKNNSFFLLNDDANRLGSGSKQSENIILGERLLSDSSINVSHGEHNPAPFDVKKENESTSNDAVKEGIQSVLIRGKFRSEENQDCSCKLAFAVAEGKEFQGRESQTRNTTVAGNNSEAVLLCDDASPLVCAKPNGGASNGVSDGVLAFRGTNLAAYGNKNHENITAKGKMNKIPDGMAKERRKMVRVDLGIPKDDALTAIAANITNYDLTCLDQSNNEASYSDMEFSDDMNYSQSQNSVLSSSHGKYHKKVRKLRMLEDIMKSEELHISKKVRTLKEDAEICEIKNYDDGSNCEAQPGDCKRNLVSLNSKVTLTNPIKSIEANQNKDEELSLMHWLKKVSKKFVANGSPKKKALVAKGYAQIKHIENKVGVSPSTHIEKDVDGLPKGSSASKHNKNYAFEKENKEPQGKPSGHCLVRQHQSLISKDATGGCVQPENVYSTIRNIISAHGDLDGSCYDKADSNRRKKKASQIEDQNSSQINWSKKEVTKKQRTTQTHEKETLDDIPMDIVELLAKHQHERSLMNVEVANKTNYESSMLNGETRHENDSYVSGYCGSKVLNSRYKSHATSNNTGYDIPTAPHGNQNAGYGSETCKSVKYQKPLLIDLNQQATDFLTSPEYDGDQHWTTHLPAVDSKKTHSLPNSSWSRMRMQDLGSYQDGQGVSAQNSSRGIHDILTVPLNGRIFGVNTRNLDSYCNYGKMVPYDSFINRSQRTVVQKTDYQKPMNLTSSHLNGGGKFEQSMTRTTLPTRSYLMEGGSRCHSGRTAPLDFPTNETISALHLLRLVDQAALSGASWDINHRRISQDSKLKFNSQSNDVLGAEVGNIVRENPENLFTAGYSAYDPNEGNFSKPHRPVPRIGVLGSLLQKEIMTHSNKHMATLGSKVRCLGEPPSVCIDGMAKTDAPSSGVNNKYGDSSGHLSVTTRKAGDSPLHKFERGQVGISKKDERVQSVRHDCITVNCVVNRNPADFSIPDEDNIYMRGSEVLSSKCLLSHKSPWHPTHHDGKKWQVAKLPVLKRS